MYLNLCKLISYLRSTIEENRLSRLALLHVHNGVEVDLSKVIEIFMRRYPRRMISFDQEPEDQGINEDLGLHYCSGTFNHKGNCVCLLVYLTH